MGQLRLFGRWDLRTPERALTVNTGSYILGHFNGTAVNALFDVSLNQPALPTLAWRIDDGAWQESEIAAKLKLADGLTNGPHTLWLMVRGLDEHESRWNAPLTSSVTFLGLEMPGGGTLLAPLDEWDHPKLKIEFLGDSITEGVLVQAPRPGKDSWAWQTDALDSHACQTAMLLGAAWRQVGFGATGLAHGGSGGAPGALDSFNFFHAGCPRDDWQPELVVVDQGTNDGGMPSDQYRPLYAKYLALIRAGYPKAKIAAVRPFNGAQEAAIKEVVASLQAAGDAQVYYIDTTGWYSGTLHPNAEASKGIAAKLAEALKSSVLK
jgi:lysophospholipase L1-like esterase